MSFTCAKCYRPQPPGTTPVYRVTETRAKTYPARKYRHGGHNIEDPGGRGRETVHAENWCARCARPPKSE
jgi:hypothetical protein